MCLICRQEEEEAQIDLLRQEEMHQKRLREEEATRRKAERMRAEMIKVRGLLGIVFGERRGGMEVVMCGHMDQGSTLGLRQSSLMLFQATIMEAANQLWVVVYNALLKIDVTLHSC